MPLATKREVTKGGLVLFRLDCGQKSGSTYSWPRPRETQYPYPVYEALCSPEENHKALTSCEFSFLRFFPVQFFLRTGSWSGSYRP